MQLLLVALFFLVRITELQAQAVQCELGDATAEWGILYKQPSSQKAYVFDATVAQQRDTWQEQTKELDKDDQSVGKMVKAVADSPNDFNVIAYSNFPPYAREAIACGSETKGALIYKDNNGALLTHTVDRWPKFAKYEAPPLDKAALIVCINVAETDFPAWGDIMDYQDPFIYFVVKTNGDKGLEKIPSLKKIIDPPVPRYTPYVKNNAFKSADQTLSFRIISKLNLAHQDIYSSYMTVVLKRSFLVWSEKKTYKLLNSTCTTKYKVENVKPGEIKVSVTSIRRESDTSSWAVSKGSNLFCMSNADRTEVGRQVGAGVLCIQNQKVHDMFKKMTSKPGLESCS